MKAAALDCGILNKDLKVDFNFLPSSVSLGI